MDTAQLVAVLNDLLQLDQDAIGASNLALRKLESVTLKAQLRACRRWRRWARTAMTAT
jgi:hypothetical protein